MPLKVLYMLHDSRRSGVPAVMSAVVRALDRSRAVPSVLFAYGGVYSEELRGNGVEVRVFGKRRPFVWRAHRFLFNLCLLKLRAQFDVVHVASTKLALSVLVAKWLGMRVVYHLHELPRKPGMLLRQAMKSADCVVFCSRTCQTHFAEVPARRKRTIVNAMAFGEGAPVGGEKPGRKIVMAASINKNKGQDLLVEAFSRIRSSDAELWLYGTTGLSARKFVRHLKKFVSERGLAERVFFPGPTADVLRVFADAAVVAHTSWTESFGMALVEAMSCGVPVVAHRLEGMTEVIEDGVTGFLVEPGAVEQITARIDELLASPDLCRRMGEAGYRSVRRRFDIARRIGEYHELYEEICKK